MNLNDTVLVRLNRTGESAWSNWYDGEVPIAIRDAATLADGRVRFQLHELMMIFGPHCFMGGESPIVDNEVEFEATEKAIAEERERCAKIAKEMIENADHPAIHAFSERQSVWNVACREIGKAIRRGE